MIIPANHQSLRLLGSNLFDKDRSFPYLKVRDDNPVYGKAGLHFPAPSLLPCDCFLRAGPPSLESFSELFLPFSQFSELSVMKHKLFEGS